MFCVALSDASPPCLPHPVFRACNPRSVLAAHNSFLASRAPCPCLAVLPPVPSSALQLVSHVLRPMLAARASRPPRSSRLTIRPSCLVICVSVSSSCASVLRLAICGPVLSPCAPALCPAPHVSWPSPSASHSCLCIPRSCAWRLSSRCLRRFAAGLYAVCLSNIAASPSMIRGLVLTPVQRDVIRCQLQKTTLF